MTSRRTLLLAAPALTAAAVAAAPALTASAVPTPQAVRVSASSAAVEVRALQRLLTASGFRTAADGIHGRATRAAITSFQRAARLTADGIAGPATMWSLLGSTAAGVGVRIGRADAAAAAEELLRRSGAPVRVDARFDARDAAHLAAFQRKRALPMKGRVDALTWSWLFVPGAAGTSPAAGAGDAFTPAFRRADEHVAGLNPHALTAVQRANARFLIAVGKGAGIDEFGIATAIAVAMRECWLYNRYYVSDHDSSGMFQQRPSQGWGSYPQVRDKYLSARAFFGVATHTRNPGLVQVRRRYPSVSMGVLGARIQRPAAPTAYADAIDRTLGPAARRFYAANAGSVKPYAG